ncbi:uncharacterized protein LOC135961239 [Calliphora vicina]|uniref:uncharacterized protein LOC135961239 n=1 Tax=Calliphora vicina TaxID=7373 RepID=UPI00325B8B90
MDLKSFDDDYRSTPESFQSLPALKFKKRELSELWSKIYRKYTQIRESSDLIDPKKAETINLTEIAQNVRSAKSFYRICMISIDESIDKFNKANETRPSLPEPPRPDNSVAFNVPPCDMPTFNGDFKSWPSFRDLFKAIYGNNTRISEVEKLFYLKQKTSGEAKEIVDDAPLTNEGFLIAWTQLVSQFENKRMQINAQLKTLFNLPSVSTMCSASIRILQRKINCCIANLNSLEIDTDNWDPIFIYLCLTKLPRETRREFERTLHDCSEMPSWTDLDLFLTNTFKELISVDDLPDTSSYPNPNPKTKHRSENTNHNHRNYNVSSVTHENDTRDKIKPQPKQNLSYPTQTLHTNKPNGSICTLCNATHTLRDCPSFISMEVNDRINFVKNSGCCYNCLAISHGVKECTSSFTCRYCGGKHNTFLHRPNQNTSSNPNPTDEQPSVSSQNSSQSFSTLTHHSETLLDDRKKLLGTAVLNIEIDDSLLPARALIDPASDFSFISDQFRRRLRLPTKPIKAEISGLNEVVSASSNQMCEVTLRSNTQKEFSLEIQAIVIETLTRTLPTQSINPNVKKDLKNIQLADPRFYESRPIDLIIGSDFYPQIIKSGVKNNILNTLLAQDTKFGWILTGPVEETHHTRTQPQTQRVVSYFSSVTQNKSSTQERSKSVEETKCKDIFSKTTQNIPDARYQELRTRKFKLKENNVIKNSKTMVEADNVLQECVDLCHTKPTQFKKDSSSTTWNCLPHHAVATPDRFMTNFSFNVLSDTLNDNSLIDALYPSPTLKNEYPTELNKGCCQARENVHICEHMCMSNPALKHITPTSTATNFM